MYDDALHQCRETGKTEEETERRMQVYKAPTADIRFIYETLGFEALSEIKEFEDFDLETAIAILEETGEFCSNEMLPLNRVW